VKLAALALCLLATHAMAEPVALPKSKALLDVPKAWARLPDDPAVVAAFRNGNVLLVISRAQVPNISAWIKASRETYAQEVERGDRGGAWHRKLARAFADITSCRRSTSSSAVPTVRSRDQDPVVPQLRARGDVRAPEGHVARRRSRDREEVHRTEDLERHGLFVDVVGQVRLRQHVVGVDRDA
jgi:hypothetical protein